MASFFSFQLMLFAMIGPFSITRCSVPSVSSRMAPSPSDRPWCQPRTAPRCLRRRRWTAFCTHFAFGVEEDTRSPCLSPHPCSRTWPHIHEWRL
jgi:hypothetical protein